MKYIKISIISIILISTTFSWRIIRDDTIFDCSEGNVCKVYRQFAVPFETDLKNIFIPPPNSTILEAIQNNSLTIFKSREGDYIYDRYKFRRFIPRTGEFSPSLNKIEIVFIPHNSKSLQISCNWNILITLLTSVWLLR